MAALPVQAPPTTYIFPGTARSQDQCAPPSPPSLMCYEPGMLLYLLSFNLILTALTLVIELRHNKIWQVISYPLIQSHVSNIMGSGNRNFYNINAIYVLVHLIK